MTPKVKRLYKAAKADEAFKRAMLKADPSNKSGFSFFLSDMEKHIIVSMYYGYLVGQGLEGDPYENCG